jgi:predicted acylesterase/phospholipase RssA
VLHALETAGVPVDVIGGTSIGAVMGGLYAQGLPHAERVERALRGFTRSGSLASPTLPLVALSSGSRVDRLLVEYFGRNSIENLPVHFFCVSANLTRAEEVVHERGPLWQAIRASLSLPGIFPPVYADGDLLVDGGALDNVPAEAMRARIGGGTVVAVDISPAVEPMTVAPFGPGLSGWQVLAGRLNPLSPPQPVPSVFDIVSRATAVRHAAPPDDAGRRPGGPAAAPAGPGHRRPGLQGRRRADRDRLPARGRGAGGFRYPRPVPKTFRCERLLSRTGPLLRCVPQ